MNSSSTKLVSLLLFKRDLIKRTPLVIESEPYLKVSQGAVILQTFNSNPERRADNSNRSYWKGHRQTLRQSTQYLSHDNIGTVIICSGYVTPTAWVFIIYMFISLYTSWIYLFPTNIYPIIILSPPILM